MDLGTVFHVLLTALAMLFMICLLVAAHEYGHYLFARIFGMGVEEFAIGFGKRPIWTWMRKTYSVEAVPGPAGKSAASERNSYDYPTDGANALQPELVPEPSPTPTQGKLVTTETTDFTIRPWPLGGFVRIKGMLPEDDGSETTVPGGFYSKAPWKRFIVLLAGPVFSVAAGVIILFFLTLAVGKTVQGTTLGNLIKGGAADKAGLLPGDKVLEIDGKKIASPPDVAFSVRDQAGKPINVVIQRGTEQKTLTITPSLEKEPSPVINAEGIPTGEFKRQGKLEAYWDPNDQRHVSVSVGEAFMESARVPYTVVTTLARLVTQPKQLKENVGGPISIAKATSEAVRLGPETVVALAAMLSISVGIFNLLPIPPLDGGQMMVALIEMLRGGRRLSIKIQGAIATAGFALVAMLIITVMTIDVGRLTEKPKEAPELVKKDGPGSEKK